MLGADSSSSFNPVFVLCYLCMLSRYSHVQFWATLWTIAHHALLSTGFSRQEYWSALSYPPAGIEPVSLVSPALAGRFFTTSAIWEVQCYLWRHRYCGWHRYCGVTISSWGRLFILSFIPNEKAYILVGTGFEIMRAVAEIFLVSLIFLAYPLYFL